MLASEFIEEINYALSVHPSQSGGSYNRALQVLNISGEFLVVTKMGGWNCLSSAVATIEIGDDGKGLLPSNFASLSGAYSGGTGVYLSTADIVVGRGVGFAVTYEETKNGRVAHMVSGSGGPATLRIVYDCGWRKIKASNETVGMPEFIRPLLLEVCRQYASGLEGVEGRNPDMSKLQAVLRSDLYRRIAAFDGSYQHDMGALGPAEGMAAPGITTPLTWPLPS